MEVSVRSDIFVVGKKFNSFKELEDSIHIYEQKSFCNLLKGDSKKLNNVKRILTKTFNESLNYYYYIKYVCYFGGQYRSRSNGIRQKQSLKGSCPVHLSLGVSSDGQTLEVKSIDLNHNHERNELFFNYLPPQRKLDQNNHLIPEMLSLGANKKLLQAKIRQETGQIVTLKSLHNVKKNAPSHKTDMDYIYKVLTSDYKCDVRVLSDEANRVTAILFVDEEMKRILTYFPEVLFVDATYKLLDSRAPLYLTATHDSMDMTHISSGCIMYEETEAVINWYLDELLSIVPSLKSNVLSIITDKDVKLRKALKNHFPNAEMILCKFHVYQIFQRELKLDKYNIKKDIKERMLVILSRMFVVKNEDDYKKLCNELYSYKIDNFNDYFLKNWDTIKSQWIISFSNVKHHYNNLTNNRLESINSKIKSTVNKFSTLEDFFKNFFKVLTSMRTERTCHIVTELSMSCMLNLEGDIEQNYWNILTLFSFNLITEELSRIEKNLDNGLRYN